MPTTLSCVILLTYKLCISQFISFIIKDIWVSTKFKCFSGLCGEVVVDDSVCNDLKPFFSLNWLKCYTNITWKTVVCFLVFERKTYTWWWCKSSYFWFTQWEYPNKAKEKHMKSAWKAYKKCMKSVWKVPLFTTKDHLQGIETLCLFLLSSAMTCLANYNLIKPAERKNYKGISQHENPPYCIVFWTTL